MFAEVAIDIGGNVVMWRCMTTMQLLLRAFDVQGIRITQLVMGFGYPLSPWRPSDMTAYAISIKTMCAGMDGYPSGPSDSESALPRRAIEGEAPTHLGMLRPRVRTKTQ